MAIQPPQINRNLTVGSTGPDVKALQEWLKSQNFFPSNQATTETYGPITREAVAKWQLVNNIDTKGNPGSFGPISRNFIQEQILKTPVKAQNAVQEAPKQKTGTNTQPPVSNVDLDRSLRNLGLSDEQIASIPDNMKPVFAGMGDYFTKQYEYGTVNAVDLNAAFEAASNDPDILAKYGDSLKMGVDEFNKTLGQYQSELTQGMSDYERQFKEDQRKLQETEAGAGRAYSGFRQQATEKLAKDEASIIESTRTKATKALGELTSAFEKKYGTEALKSSLGTNPFTLKMNNPITGNTMDVTATPLGGITGTDTLAKGQDILQRQKELLTLNTIK